MQTPTASRPPTWRERAIDVHADSVSGMDAHQIAEKHGINHRHARRLIRVYLSLGEKTMGRADLDSLSLADAEKIANFSPSERRAAITSAKRARPRAVRKITIQSGGRELKPSGRAKLIRQMQESGATKREIAVELNTDPATITLWSEFDQYAKVIQDAIDAGHISLFAARCMQGMSEQGQVEVWGRHTADFLSMSAHAALKEMRAMYDPYSHPEMYEDPAMSQKKHDTRERGRMKSTDSVVS